MVTSKSQSFNVWGLANHTLSLCRGGSRTAATSKMEDFVIIVNGWKPLTIITKTSILDVSVVLDPPLLLHITLYNSARV